MTSPTPPEAPFDKDAHAWADAMVGRVDFLTKTLGPLWGRWALVEAFAAGRASVQGVAGASTDKLGGRAVTESDPRIVALLARIASEPERAATFICAVVNVAVAVEREACAKVVETTEVQGIMRDAKFSGWEPSVPLTLWKAAAAIRGRS